MIKNKELITGYEQTLLEEQLTIYWWNCREKKKSFSGSIETYCTENNIKIECYLKGNVCFKKVSFVHGALKCNLDTSLRIDELVLMCANIINQYLGDKSTIQISNRTIKIHH